MPNSIKRCVAKQGGHGYGTPSFSFSLFQDPLILNIRDEGVNRKVHESFSWRLVAVVGGIDFTSAFYPRSDSTSEPRPKNLEHTSTRVPATRDEPNSQPHPSPISKSGMQRQIPTKLPVHDEVRGLLVIRYPTGGRQRYEVAGVLVSPQKRQPGSQTPTSRRPSMNRQPVKREGNQRSGNHGGASPSSPYGQEGGQPPGNQGGASRPSSYSMPAVAASARRSCL